MNDYLNCELHGFGGFSPFCEDFTNPQIELPPPIMGTYIRPPWNGIIFPPVIIETPVINVPTITPPVSVPEPATYALLGLELVVLVMALRRRRG